MVNMAAISNTPLTHKQKVRKGTNHAWCSVPKCSADATKELQISFHAFPTDKSRCADWVQAIKRQIGPKFQIKQGSTYVCSKHFRQDDYKYTPNRTTLKKTAVPSVFSWSTATRKSPRKLPNKPGISIQLKKRFDEALASKPPTVTPLVQEPSPSCEPEPMQVVETEECKPSCKEKMAALEKRCEELELKLQMERFGLERYGNDMKLLNHYTGFDSYTMFVSLFDCLKPSATNMKSHYYIPSETISLSGRPRTLLLIDELYLFLCRLRAGLSQEVLRDMFKISQGTVSRHVITWANFLYFTLGSLPLWLSKSQIKELMPTSFEKAYPNTRVILDATEIKTQYASSLVLGTQLYSHYKSSPTFKALIGIAPHGAITFISSLYSGNISDVELTKQSGVLDLLENGDEVMADKGFTISKLVQERGASLNIPHFLRNKGQFTDEERKANEKIASLRIHVERAIRRIKEYKLFQTPIPLNLTGTINQLWTVACIFSTFSDPLIADSQQT